jgi:hypothetical protein
MLRRISGPETERVTRSRIHYFFSFYLVCEAIGTAATPCLLCQSREIVKMIVEKLGGMKIGRGNRSTRRKPASAPLYPLQISHD